MAIIWVLLLVLVAIFVGAGIALYRRQVSKVGADKQAPGLPFRWKYILLPAIFLLISLILVACFYSKMPFQIAYHFDATGAPDRWAIREFAIAITLVVQLILLLVSFFIVTGVRRNAFFTTSGEAIIKPETMITLMGNLPAFLQVIILFEMGDIFSYNAFYKHVFPQWLFMVIVLVLATAAFLTFIIIIGLKAIRQTKQ